MSLKIRTVRPHAKDYLFSRNIGGMQKLETVEDRIRFLINFSNQDLNALSDGDLLNLKEEMISFLGETPDKERPVGQFSGLAFTSLSKAVDIDRFEKDDFSEVQSQMKLIVKKVADQNELLKDQENAIDVFRVDLSNTHLGMFGYPGQFVIHFFGEAKKMIIIAALILLRNNAVGKILRCGNPECPDGPKVFFKIGRTKFCSKTCTQFVTRRRWRSDPKNIRKESIAARERMRKYRERLKKQKEALIKNEPEPKPKRRKQTK